jgi:hypothetical protein
VGVIRAVLQDLRKFLTEYIFLPQQQLEVLLPKLNLGFLEKSGHLLVHKDPK